MDNTNRFNEVESKGLKLPESIVELTATEKDIVHLLSDEFLTIKQIASRRNCSIQAVYKILRNLKKKGVLDIGMNKVEKIEPTFNQADVRLHGQELNVRLIFQNPTYQEQLKKSDTIFIDGNTIRLYKNAIEVYSGQSFYGKTASEAEKKSLDYWNRFLIRLEHELSVCLIKARSRNIKIVNQHYARGDSEICDDAIRNRERVWIYAEEDGKLCFITDDSFGFREDETVHPKTAKIDRKAIDKQINDWRLNNPPTNTEINTNLNNAVQILLSNQELIAGLPNVLNKLEKQIASHLRLIKEYRRENKHFRKSLEIKYRINNKPYESLKRWL